MASLLPRRVAAIVVGWSCAIVACGGPAPQQQAARTGPRLYVTNETSGDLTVVDASTDAVLATIPLGKRPRGIAVSPDRRTLYVALSGSPPAGPGVDEKSLPPPDRAADGIGVVDLRAGKLVKVLPGGSDPEQVAVSRDGRQLFVANEDAAQLSVIDVALGRVAETFKIGAEPEGVSVSPDGRLVYVTSEGDGAVFVVDVAGHKVVKSVEVPPRPRSIAFLPNGTRAYVTSENGAALTVIDTATHDVVGSVALGEGMRPMGVVAAPDGKFVYSTTGRSRMVLIVDTSSNQVVEIGRAHV